MWRRFKNSALLPLDLPLASILAAVECGPVKAEDTTERLTTNSRNLLHGPHIPSLPDAPLPNQRSPSPFPLTPRVFPDPVLEMPTKSFPDRANGQACACIGVGAV